MKSLREKIRTANLTKTETIIGEYMLDHYESACFMTSTSVAEKVNVSEASVIRFCKALGYSGYVDFQKSLQRQYKKKVKSISSNIVVPAERLSYLLEPDTENMGNYIDVHFQNTLNNLENVMLNNRRELFTQAADIIVKSKKKYILASRANTCQGDYCLLYMKHMLDNVISASYGAVSVIDHMCDISKDDCVIVYSFPRYSESDKLALEMAFEVGAKIIVITDRQSATLAQYANVLFTATVDSNTFFNSYTGVQFLTELLCNAISQVVGKPMENRLNQIDKYLSPIGSW